MLLPCKPPSEQDFVHVDLCCSVSSDTTMPNHMLHKNLPKCFQEEDDDERGKLQMRILQLEHENSRILLEKQRLEENARTDHQLADKLLSRIEPLAFMGGRSHHKCSGRKKSPIMRKLHRRRRSRRFVVYNIKLIRPFLDFID